MIILILFFIEWITVCQNMLGLKATNVGYVLLFTFMSMLCNGFDVEYYPPKSTVNMSSVSSCLLACSRLYTAWLEMNIATSYWGRGQGNFYPSSHILCLATMVTWHFSAICYK